MEPIRFKKDQRGDAEARRLFSAPDREHAPDRMKHKKTSAPPRLRVEVLRPERPLTRWIVGDAGQSRRGPPQLRSGFLLRADARLAARPRRLPGGTRALDPHAGDRGARGGPVRAGDAAARDRSLLQPAQSVRRQAAAHRPRLPRGAEGRARRRPPRRPPVAPPHRAEAGAGAALPQLRRGNAGGRPRPSAARRRAARAAHPRGKPLPAPQRALRAAGHHRPPLAGGVHAPAGVRRRGARIAARAVRLALFLPARGDGVPRRVRPGQLGEAARGAAPDAGRQEAPRLRPGAPGRVPFVAQPALRAAAAHAAQPARAGDPGAGPQRAGGAHRLPRVGAGEAAVAARAAAVPIRAALERVPPILTEPLTDRRQIDAHRDHLAAATKDAIGAIATALDPRLSRQALFDAQEGRAELSERLRLDLCVFREMCRATAERLAQSGAEVAMAQPLRRFSLEFRDVGYQLLRHSDRELFDRFLDLLESWGGSALQNTPQRIQKLREDCRRFAEILDRALENVNKRSELQKLPLDERTVREALARRLQPV